MADMARDERLDAIVDIITKEEKVQISDLVQKFNVTDMTIRRDFDTLVSKGKIIRTHGGAILANPEEDKNGIMLEPSYMIRVAKQSRQKSEISHAAIQLVQSNQYIFLDSGTTTLGIAKAMSKNVRSTIITNGINIASELLLHQYPNVITLGGGVDLNTWSTRGPLAEAQIDQFHADIAFLGCNAISPNGDVMIGNLPEIALKRKIINISHKLYLVADSSKFDRYSLMTYASVQDFDGIITDNGLPEELRKKIRQEGGNLIISSKEENTL